MRPNPGAVDRAAIIGAGTIGASWAALFLARGIAVVAVDPADGAERALRRSVEGMWPALEALGVVAEGADPGRISVIVAPGKALGAVGFVQENAPEDRDLKQQLFAEIERWVAPETVLASSTTALRISEVQTACRHPERCLAGHPFNPPHILPLVEVSGGALTGPEAVDWAMAFYARLKRKPVRLARDIEGHIAGRLSAALWREAVSLVEKGVASVAEIDAAVRYGPGLRWSAMGPHMAYHLGGGAGGMAHYLAHLGDSQQRRWADLGTPELTEALKAAIVDGVTEEAEGRTVEDLAAARDRKLIAALRALETEDGRRAER